MQEPTPPANPLPPVSTVAGDVGRLLQLGWLEAPSRPGWLATLEHYQLVGELGCGGMGLVFKAIDARDGQTVAIKLLRPELAELPQQVHRFLKEARHMLRLKHPNILPVLYVSENSDTPFFVTPLMARGCLSRQLSESHPFDEVEAIAVARQIAAALQHAHKRGVTHRDLKPGNVLLNEHGTAYLADFGLARTVLNDSVINPAVAMIGEGTAHYISPQLACGEAEDTRCDIYAFGAMLYEMVSGRPPYEGSSTAQILEQIKLGPPVPITKLRPGLRPNFVRIVEGAMAREHRDRYANMEDVVADLEHYQTGLPTCGPKRTFSIRHILPARRPVVLVGSFVLLLMGLAWQMPEWLRKTNHLTLRGEIVVPEVVSWANSRFGDWDGDGESDVINLVGNSLHIVLGEGHRQQPVKLETVSTNPARLGLMADINGDGRDEAFVTWNNPTNACLSVFNQRGWPIQEFRFSGNLGVHPHWGTNQTQLDPLNIGDLDGDGKPELVAAVTSSWSLRPRGIACYDVSNGGLKWFFETATFVVQAELCDVEGDGRIEVLVGSNSPGNGSKLPDGTDDQHAYLYVLTPNGVLLWRRELAGVFATVRPLIVGPTNPVVNAWVAAGHEYSAQRGEPDTGKVVAFDKEGKLLANRDFKVQLTSVRALNLPNDAAPRILVADRLANLHVLDGMLNPIHSLQLFTPQFASTDLQIVSNDSLDSAAASPIVVCSSQIEMRTAPAPGNSRLVFENIFHHDNRVTILDQELNHVATHLIWDKWTQNPGMVARWFGHRTKTPRKLLVLSDRIQFFGFGKHPDD